MSGYEGLRYAYRCCLYVLLFTNVLSPSRLLGMRCSTALYGFRCTPGADNQSTPFLQSSPAYTMWTRSDFALSDMHPGWYISKFNVSSSSATSLCTVVALANIPSVDVDHKSTSRCPRAQVLVVGAFAMRRTRGSGKPSIWLTSIHPGSSTRQHRHPALKFLWMHHQPNLRMFATSPSPSLLRSCLPSFPVRRTWRNGAL